MEWEVSVYCVGDSHPQVFRTGDPAVYRERLHAPTGVLVFDDARTEIHVPVRNITRVEFARLA